MLVRQTVLAKTYKKGGRKPPTMPPKDLTKYTLIPKLRLSATGVVMSTLFRGIADPMYKVCSRIAGSLAHMLSLIRLDFTRQGDLCPSLCKSTCMFVTFRKCLHSVAAQLLQECRHVTIYVFLARLDPLYVLVALHDWLTVIPRQRPC